MNESSALNPAFTYTPSPAIQLAPGIPRLCLLCWKCKWPPWLFSFQWILSIVALVLTLTQGLYPLSQLPTPPPILMFYIAITLAFVSFLRSLRLRETLHCTDFSMQWCAYRYIGNKFKTKKVSKKKNPEATMQHHGLSHVARAEGQCIEWNCTWMLQRK